MFSRDCSVRVHRENPNKKWDWYTIGGRWNGFFQSKTCGHANQIVKSDIDFESMKQASRQEANELYDKFFDFCCKYPNFKGWSHFRESMPIDDAREAYNTQPGRRDLDEIEFSMECLFDKLSIGREKYVAQSEASSFVTFAVLKDGNWYERGKMGWWGMVRDEKDTDDWNAQFMSLLESLPDDTVLTVVDCHI